MKNKQRKVMVLCVLMMLSFMQIGCGNTYFRYTVREMPEENPTAYIYPFSVAQVRKALQNHTKTTRYHICRFVSNGDIPEAYKYLQVQENLDDVVIEGYNISELYRTPDFYRNYNTVFHVHLQKISETSTLVKINTLKSKLIIGMVNLSKLIPDPGTFLYKDVPPTSIEQYELLLKIGEQLGMEKAMPPLILPKELPEKPFKVH